MSHKNKNIDVRQKVALAMMVKNEERRITVSFDSVIGVADTFIILDTGSDDNTINICREYCKRNKVTLHLKQEPFVDFCVSRNVLLDFADKVLVKKNVPDKRFLLLLDCNDEFRSPKELVEFISNFKGSQTGFHLKQNWKTGNSLDSYFNIRMVISHNGWRYKAPVHEYICKSNPVSDSHDILRLEKIILFQDRTLDDDKSQRRFKRDKELLYNEILKNPEDPRSYFYLAQTCGCLSLMHEAFFYYICRSNLIGFIEEIYQSYFRLGETCQLLNFPLETSVKWFLKAYSHSQRVEPLVKLGEIFKSRSFNNSNAANFDIAYLFASNSAKLMYPHNQILFIDKHSYVYKRWHLLGIIGWYVNRFKEGKAGAIKALQHELSEIDESNLTFYLKKEIELSKAIKDGTAPNQNNSKWRLSWDYGNIDEVTDNIKSLSKYYFNGLKSLSLNRPAHFILLYFIKEFASTGRVEPLNRLGEYFMGNNLKGESIPDWALAFMFLNAACELKELRSYSNEDERKEYQIKRWIGLVHAAVQVGRYSEGMVAVKECKRKGIKIDPAIEMEYLQGCMGHTSQIKSLFAVSAGQQEAVLEVIKENCESNNFSKQQIVERVSKKL